VTLRRSKAARRAALALLAAACGLGGCRRTARAPDEQIGFFLSSRQDLQRTARVVLVELASVDECPPQIARDTTQALASAIQARQLFHVDVVRRTDPLCRDLPIEGVEALTLPELAAIRDALGCDAVLFGRVSHFQPFPRMQIGLYLKLIHLRDGKLVWGVDHVWDTTDRTTELRIEEYFRHVVRSGYDPLGPELVFKSPRAFQRFVAWEVAGTLAGPQDGAEKAAPRGRSLK